MTGVELTLEELMVIASVLEGGIEGLQSFLEFTSKDDPEYDVACETLMYSKSALPKIYSFLDCYMPTMQSPFDRMN